MIYNNITQRRLDLHYRTLPREIILAQLGIVHEELSITPEVEFSGFVGLFHACVIDCDRQYLEIRQARRNLLQYDETLTGTSILPEVMRVDEMVNWRVNEPVVTVHLDPQARHSHRPITMTEARYLARANTFIRSHSRSPGHGKHPLWFYFYRF